MPLTIKDIEEFPIDELPMSCSLVMVGQPGSGKSYAIKYLFYIFKHRYPVCKVISGSEDTNGFYSEFIPKIVVSAEYDDDDMKDLILRQKRCMKNGCGNGASITVVDDCSDQPSIFKGSTYKALLKIGSRHWNQLFITGLQYAIDFPPDIRKCISFVFIFYEDSEDERKKLFKNYGGACGTFDQFQDIMEQLRKPEDPDDTDKYTCMVIRKLDVEDIPEGSIINDHSIFFFKAGYIPPDFKFGCKELWDWDAQRRDPKKTFFEDVY